jgi:glycosyltransferase involved in cell wall biosynthesis
MSLGIDVYFINGQHVGDRSGGEFLDPCLTWIWKGSQVANLAKMFSTKIVRDGDVFLSLDGWGPSTEAIAYMRDALGLDVKLVIFLHAGSYDPWDFLARKNMNRWARGLEESWVSAADLILVGSDFHRKLLIEKRGAEDHKIFTCGCPIHRSKLVEPIAWEEKENIVVFPHRLAPEKAPWEFDRIRELCKTEAMWIKTRDPAWKGTNYDGFTSKTHYYDLLRRAKVVVSTARQETFGIAMQEGIALGAWAVAPDRLSYPELISKQEGKLYPPGNLQAAADFVSLALTSRLGPTWNEQPERAILRAGVEILGRFS